MYITNSETYEKEKIIAMFETSCLIPAYLTWYISDCTQFVQY